MPMGPLEGIRIVELAGIGPGPFCAMLLSDMGAEIIRVDRAAMVGLDTDRDGNDSRFNLLSRGRRNIAVDLKNPAAVDAVLRLIDRADALLEGFRPGVMERLGLGPDLCLARNPKLVYGRMTGWGQDGPIARIAGHDINYIALSGVLHSIGEPGGPPVPPLNLVGDFGGGALYLAMGVLAGIISARVSGKGQVVDCSMVEGSASLLTMMYAALASGAWTEERARTAPMAARTITTSTRPATASMSQSARSSRNSMPSCCSIPGSKAKACPSRPIAPNGPRFRSAWPISSRPRRAPSGPRSWSRPISASPRSCACPRRSPTRTTAPARAL